MPNLKFLASAVPEILGGSQNSKSGSPDPTWPLLIQFCRFWIFLPVFNLSVKFDANSFIDDWLWLFYDSAHLAVKCLFGPFFVSFFCDFNFLSPWNNSEIIVLFPEGTRRQAFWDIARWNRFSGLISSLVQILALGLRKKVIGKSQKGYFLRIWGEAPSYDNVTKFCMWVFLSDVIMCARFYLYRPHSFLGARPEN